jgi:RNA polymerase sigma-70 factor (ECF subfamily)
MVLAKDEDLDLVRRARAGDYGAFEQLVARHEQRVYTLARRIVHRTEDAEDVMQETFLSAMSHLRGFREESSFSTWILRIATNHALKVLRKRRGLPTVPFEESTRGDEENGGLLPRPVYIARWREDAEREADRPEVRRLLEKALAELAPKHRAIFLLRDVEGLSTEETAKTLGISVANAKVRLLRARLKLRERLTRALGDAATRVEGHDHDHDHDPGPARASGAGPGRRGSRARPVPGASS